jgi:hypothetical protein
MRLSARKLLIFIITFLGVLLFVALLWPWIAPLYTYLLAGVVATWMPDATVKVRDSTSLFVHVPPLGMTVTLGAMVFNLLLLVALLGATPGLGIRRRLICLAVGVLLQASFHVLDIVISFRANYEVALTGSYSLRFLAEMLGGVGEQVSAVIIWVLLTWRSWFPKSATLARASEHSDPRVISSKADKRLKSSKTL